MPSRPTATEHIAYYGRYIERVPEGDVVSILRSQIDETLALLSTAAARADHRYAPGKWSLKEVVAHMCDVERVMAYRALRIARGDATPLAGFDENAYAPAAECDARTLPDLVQEFQAVRGATVALFAGLPARAWTRMGTANDAPISVQALAYIIAGHELHHRTLIAERYLAAAPGIHA